MDAMLLLLQVDQPWLAYFSWPYEKPFLSLSYIPDTSMSSDSRSLQDPCRLNPSVGTRRFSWGIFEVVYDYPIRVFTLFNGTSNYTNVQYTLRFLYELHVVAPRPFLLHILGSLLIGVSPAASLYLSYSILDIINTSVDINYSYCNGIVLQLYVALWLLSGVVSTLAERTIEENKQTLGAYLQPHFLPRLADASLRLDVDILQDHGFRSILPDSWGFGRGAPGLSLVTDLFTNFCNMITLALNILVLGYIFLVSRNPDGIILAFLEALFLAIIICAPRNSIGGAGYAFYTTNRHFHRLHGLYKIIFDGRYRETLVKDNATEYLSKEFKRTADALGVSKADALELACYLPPPWYCAQVQTLFIDYPMGIYALTLPWSLSSSSITSMVLFQLACTTLWNSVKNVRDGRSVTSLNATMNQIQRFYEVLEYDNNASRDAADYPNHLTSSKGMKVSYRNVSLTYGDSTDDTAWALRNVWFDIEPGQLVVIVGRNGSGKTSLVKLLPRLTNPTCGEVLIDDIPIQDYDIRRLRNSIGFLAQTEAIYPVSLQENILLGLPDHAKGSVEKQKHVDEAAHLGGSYDLIERLGHDTILSPPNVVGQSLAGCGNGEIGPKAMEELKRHLLNFKEVSISCGEKQRLLASRTFIRVKNSDLKLLVVDEPTSALDPVAERDLLNQFCQMRKARTIIFVTHRFGNIVQRADLILCLKAGKIVQKGTHEELIRHEKGEYARLFRAAQVE